MNTITKIFKHLHVVNKHRWYVFIYACKAGIPFRGLIHDLSKYSPTEFFESVKYFNGHRSPIISAREENGYSKAWLHHKGRNKHHFEYWEDLTTTKRIGSPMPYKYAVECICDKLAACKAYNGKGFNQKQPLDYWNKADKESILEKNIIPFEFVETVLTKIANDGINKTLKKKYLKITYNEIKKKYSK